MKHLLLLAFIAVSAITISSCDCRGPFGGNKIVCSNGGTCNDGECDCLKGYFGTNCTDVDSCELLDVFCERGECLDGSCICDEGYEGDSCNIETRGKFIAYYGITESCAGLDTVTGHSIWIERDAVNGANIFIYNLFTYENFERNGYFSKIEATAVKGTNTFNISNQRPDGGVKSINGTGSITVVDENRTDINITFTHKNGDKDPVECIVTGIRIPDPM